MMNMMQDYAADSNEVIDRRIVKTEYRNYDIVARYWEYCYMGKLWKCRRAVEEFEDYDGVGIDSLVSRMKARVDELIEERSRARGNRKPDQAELKAALKSLSLAGKVPELTRQALTAHAAAGQGRADAVYLQRLTGLSCTAAIHTLYSNLAVKLCDEIAYHDPDSESGFPALGLILTGIDDDGEILTLSNCAKNMILEMGWQ